jgi:hypothetical protein
MSVLKPGIIIYTHSISLLNQKVAYKRCRVELEDMREKTMYLPPRGIFRVLDRGERIVVVTRALSDGSLVLYEGELDDEFGNFLTLENVTMFKMKENGEKHQLDTFSKILIKRDLISWIARR